ncbi:MAG TPA: hypothetical protein VGM21_15710 [Actinomycetota bacterium]|jgi:hypothetical protein
MSEDAQQGRSEYQELTSRIEELTEEVRRLRAEGAHQGHHGLGFSEEEYQRYLAVRDRLHELGIESDDFRSYLNVLNLRYHDEGGLLRRVRPC